MSKEKPSEEIQFILDTTPTPTDYRFTLEDKIEAIIKYLDKAHKEKCFNCGYSKNDKKIKSSLKRKK